MRTTPQAGFHIAPVQHATSPRYPGNTDPLDLADHLRPSVLDWFSAKTVALSALFALGGGALAVAPAADEEKNTVAVDEKKVQAVIEQYLQALGDEAQYDALEKQDAPLGNNPSIYTAIRKEEYQRKLRGDVIANATDPAPFIKAAGELFTLYGLKVENQVQYDRRGVQFRVDGYDEHKRIGFEFLMSPTAQSTPEEQLDEIDALNMEIKKNNVNILVLPLPTYVDFDISTRRQMEAVLRSVVDYLEWLRASGRL